MGGGRRKACLPVADCVDASGGGATAAAGAVTVTITDCVIVSGRAVTVTVGAAPEANTVSVRNDS
jgi:hypothetical protein